MNGAWAKQKALEWVLDHEQTPYREDIDSLAAMLLEVDAKARAEGRAEERREVVAYLARKGSPNAARIERGDHLKGKPK